MGQKLLNLRKEKSQILWRDHDIQVRVVSEGSFPTAEQKRAKDSSWSHVSLWNWRLTVEQLQSLLRWQLAGATTK